MKSLKISEELHAALRQEAARRKITIQELMEEIILNYFSKQRK